MRPVNRRIQPKRLTYVCKQADIYIPHRTTYFTHKHTFSVIRWQILYQDRQKLACSKILYVLCVDRTNRDTYTQKDIEKEGLNSQYEKLEEKIFIRDDGLVFVDIYMCHFSNTLW